MHKVILFVAVLGLIFAGGYLYQTSGLKNPAEKIYVAVEGESRIAVIDPEKGSQTRSIDLAIEHDGERMGYAPHNVQVAPDGETVWITANAGSHAHASRALPQAYAAAGHDDADEHGHADDMADQIIVVSAATDRIVERITVGKGLHLAHVALTPDSGYAYATAQTEGAIYKVNAKSLRIEKRIPLAASGEPHGLRVSPDGKAAYIAMLKGKSIGVLELATDSFREIPLSGAAVQAGTTPDGKYVVASIYDKKQLAVYDTASGKLAYVDLPAGAKGPVQMYATPDSKFIYLADQGYYFDQPEGSLVYKIDLASKQVVAEISGGRGPHGVVIDKTGQNVYVTNLLDGTLSVIDSATDKELKKIPVGKEPNGVSVWSKSSGGTP